MSQAHTEAASTMDIPDDEGRPTKDSASRMPLPEHRLRRLRLLVSALRPKPGRTSRSSLLAETSSYYPARIRPRSLIYLLWQLQLCSSPDNQLSAAHALTLKTPTLLSPSQPPITMKFILAATTLALAGLAQAFDNVPACAEQCIKDAIKSATTCAEADVPCACKEKDAIQAAGTSCVIDSCGLDVAISKSCFRLGGDIDC